MHFDLLHAVIATILIVLTIGVLHRTGVIEKDQQGWNWKFFGSLVLVMFAFNLVWPV